ncbi:MAG: cytochrome b/b6 domain-containing protein [Euryarchaeota archaeon TMED85]|nr:MAG: cytochrome b/b6 domain-containing protein [Euryarchaeota archaeon]RPG75549.1 MAG: cytochrome b/b6 domain-containing protein [Euryarchaeota archaeon TMED85]
MEKSHTNLAKIIHWGFIILYVYGILKQIDDLSQLEDTGLLIFEVIFASVFLLIVLIRYFYMSRFETFLGANEPVPVMHKFLAKTIHTSMYLCLILLPLTGLMIAGLFTQEIKDGPLIDVVVGLHGFSADLSYLLIAIHVVAALYSRIKGEGVWSSMVPLWKEKEPSNHEIIKKISFAEKEFFKKIEGIFSPKNK